LKVTPTLPKETIMLEMPPDIDGFIVSVDGTEYKLKDRNTVELYWDGNNFSAKGGKPLYESVDRPVIKGVYECYFRGNVIIHAKFREDRVDCQSAAKVGLILSAPKASDMKMMIKNIDPQFLMYNDILSVNDGVALIKQVALAKKDIIVTPMFVRTYLLSLGKRGDYAAINHAVNRGKLRSRLRHAEAMLLPDSTKQKSCFELHAIMRQNDIQGTPVECAKLLSKYGVTVAPRKIRLMQTRGQFALLGETLMCHSKFRRVGKPSIYYDVPKSVMQALYQYAVNNRGKFCKETTFSDLQNEMKELYDAIGEKTHTDAYSEVGDVVSVLIHLLCDKYPYIKWYSDPEIMKMFDHKLMIPFKTKMQSRLERYGCVRNHNTCGGHMCCNGNNFKAPLPRKK